MTTFTIGADPEIFLRNLDGKFVSSIGRIGGSKEQPMKTNHGSVQEDNVLAEFNIYPASSEDDFVHSIFSVLSDLENIVIPQNLKMDFSASVEFDESELNHPLARLSGCDPDYNCYTLEENQPADFWETNVRSAGGHIHVGWDGKDKYPSARADLIKSMDLFLGIPSILLDEDTRRKSLYGKAGAYRPKDYGVEYRTLSNFWLQKEELVRWVYKNTKLAIHHMDWVKDSFGNVIQNAINNNDKKLAMGIISDFEINMPQGF